MGSRTAPDRNARFPLDLSPRPLERAELDGRLRHRVVTRPFLHLDGSTTATLLAPKLSYSRFPLVSLPFSFFLAFAIAFSVSLSLSLSFCPVPFLRGES